MIKNNVNGKVYVGQSINIEKRWRTHQRELEKKEHINLALQMDYINYGSISFSYEVIEEFEVLKSFDGWKYLREAILLAKENWYIHQLEEMNYTLYNSGGSYKKEMVYTSLKHLIKYVQDNVYNNNGNFVYDDGVLPLVADIVRKKKMKEEKAERKKKTSVKKKVKEQPQMAFGISLEEARASRK